MNGLLLPVGLVSRLLVLLNESDRNNETRMTRRILYWEPDENNMERERESGGGGRKGVIKNRKTREIIFIIGSSS